MKTKTFIKNKTKSSKAGFTILETMVAALLLSMVVAVMVVATSAGFSNINNLKNSLTATYLSQEGIELVRKVRDDMVINYEDSGTRWSQFLSYVDNCEAVSGCNIWYNPTTSSVQVNTYTASSYLKYDDLTGYYGYIVGAPTSFRRKVSVEILSGVSKEILITSTVTWMQGGSEKSFETKEVVFNWF